jgi:hypothetical protein
MKKINITGILLIAGASFISSCATLRPSDWLTGTGQDSTVHGNEGSISANHEAINTLEDMTEWVIWDIEEGRTDSATGQTYIDNIEQVIIEINNQ